MDEVYMKMDTHKLLPIVFELEILYVVSDTHLHFLESWTLFEILLGHYVQSY